MAPVRVGIIGTGFGARVVAPSFEAAGCEIAGVATPRDEAASAALCARPDVDLVAVHSPPFLHRAHVEAALEHGKHVLCDKPFGLDADEAAAMLAAAEAAGVVHAVNFEFRRHPVIERMRTMVAEGAIGRPEHVQWVHVSSGTRIPLRRFGWLFDRSLGGGWIGAWCSHTIDALRFLLGEVTTVVACDGPVTVPERPDAEGTPHTCTAEDAMTATLILEGGVTVAIDSGFAATVNLPARTVVTGSEGALENVGNERLTLLRPGAAPERIDVTGDEDGHADRHALPMRRWAADLVAAVRDGRPVEPSFADGLACRRVLDALLAAAAGAPAPATPRPRRVLNASRPSPPSSASATGRWLRAMRSASAPPSTAGPVPAVQSMSVAVNVRPRAEVATRPRPARLAGDVEGDAQAALGDHAGTTEGTADVLVVHDVLVQPPAGRHEAAHPGGEVERPQPRHERRRRLHDLVGAGGGVEVAVDRAPVPDRPDQRPAHGELRVVAGEQVADDLPHAPTAAQAGGVPLLGRQDLQELGEVGELARHLRGERLLADVLCHGSRPLGRVSP